MSVSSLFILYLELMISKVSVYKKKLHIVWKDAE
jgi:hypothetical protein